MKCPRRKTRVYSLSHSTTLVRIRIKEITDKFGRVIEERVSRRERPGKVCGLCDIEEGNRAPNYTRG